MKKRELGNLFLHLGVGGALAALVCWNHWFMVLATFVYAFLREQAQHRYVLRVVHPDIGAGYDKRTFFDFGWLTWHRIWEILQWVLGAAIACGVYSLIASIPLQ